ncbi:beta-1,3-glucan linked protein [Tritrichomonas musculus]|uniref:Beta-1,3-glucan linked protein n=1 Tax=Tritrichomonas musculus TaxID=1915356 RepID=A0ABR2GZR7_9EUKA
MIPSSILLIGEKSFYNCTALKQVSMPPSIAVINSGTSEGGSSLSQISILFVNGIERNSFKDYSYLKEIKIPSSVTSISDNAFMN